jgi:hypothetical protein
MTAAGYQIRSQLILLSNAPGLFSDYRHVKRRTYSEFDATPRDFDDLNLYLATHQNCLADPSPEH